MITDDDLSFIQKGGALIGMDEVGRGCLAGPIVGAAALITYDLYSQMQEIEDLIIRDSKKMTPKQRSNTAIWLGQNVPYVIRKVEASRIDAIGIQKANNAVLYESGKALARDYDDVEIRAYVDHFKCRPIRENVPVTSMTRGDANNIAIAAASILAKVYRDTLMEKMAKEYPEYMWDSNKGYGAVAHRGAIKKYGPTPYHRMTFLTKILGNKS